MEARNKFFLCCCILLVFSAGSMKSQNYPWCYTAINLTYYAPERYEYEYGTGKRIRMIHPSYEITVPSKPGLRRSEYYSNSFFRYKNKGYVCVFPINNYGLNGRTFECIGGRDITLLDLEMKMPSYPTDTFITISQQLADSIFTRYYELTLKFTPLRNHRSIHKDYKRALRRLENSSYEALEEDYKNAICITPSMRIFLYQIDPHDYEYFSRFVKLRELQEEEKVFNRLPYRPYLYKKTPSK